MTFSIFLLSSDNETNLLLEKEILRPAGYEVTILRASQAALNLIKASCPSLVILGEKLEDGDGLSLASKLLDQYPSLPVILVPATSSDALEIKALRMGVTGYLKPPLRSDTVLPAVESAIRRKRRLEDWIQLQTRRNTKTLQRQIDGLEALQRIGRSVTSLLDLNGVLKAVVDSAVELTGAEEGSLLLLDESAGELYMRAARNFQDDFVRTFRLPLRDTLPGEVLRTGKPVILDQETPKKIKTAYLVHTLIYVPMHIQDRVIGVLGVDNRQGGKPFFDQHVTLLSALADYAAIAIENANLYSRSEIERKKLETILTHVEDGVIVVDQDQRIVLLNRTLRSALSIPSNNLAGKPIQDVIRHADLLEFLLEKRSQPCRSEIALEDGRVYNAQLTPIPEVGVAVTMQDITHLKELDRIKSEFVSTVSHDLRSPLTAILGYVELIDRAGPLTGQQREFVRRVQFSVHNITSLINDLLDLGRIEAGFDVLKEVLPLEAIVLYALEGHRDLIEEKHMQITTEFSGGLPNVLGNPLRLRQMAANLIGNAVKYTQAGGKITLRLHAELGQIIFQVCDTGPGIPPSDQPYIFDKFYRASNVASDVHGTGLGLAIVKSIVENHQGRIWVESTLGHGSTFTVVLPVVNEGG